MALDPKFKFATTTPINTIGRGEADGYVHLSMCCSWNSPLLTHSSRSHRDGFEKGWREDTTPGNKAFVRAEISYLASTSHATVTLITGIEHGKSIAPGDQTSPFVNTRIEGTF